MEEEKAAAYYDELSRKGEGAAKFKQGLGFSSSSDPFHSNKKTSSFAPLSNFVRASSSNAENTAKDENNQDSNRTSRRNGDEDRARVLDRIHGKLNRSGGGGHRCRSPSDEREKRRGERRDMYDERARDEDRHSSRKSRVRDRDGENRERRRRRSRSRSYSPPRVSRDGEKDRSREKDGSLKERRSGGGGGKVDRGVDYSRLIEGYSQMTPAERVKAKMKLQLTQTAAKDTNMGMSSGWERFDFNRDAPLDDDEDETEVADDDAAVVKDIGRSFRFSAVEARREEEVKAAHDRAMFGGAAAASLRANLAPETTVSAEKDGDDTTDDDNGNHLKSTTLISDKVLSMQQGSWRDRARRLQNASEQS